MTIEEDEEIEAQVKKDIIIKPATEVTELKQPYKIYLMEEEKIHQPKKTI